MSKACLVDTTKCIGCRACQVACKGWNELAAEETKCSGTGGGYENPPALSTKTYTRITFHEITHADGRLRRCVFAKRQCMHCREPGCVSACPVKALVKTPQGGVVWNEDLCMGCRYCLIACPFDIPKFEFDQPVPSIRKCTFCTDRIREEPPAGVQVNDEPISGESLERLQDCRRSPACATSCPTGAIKFGEREGLLDEARARIYRNPNRYVHHIYGEREVGGTDWLYLASVPFEELGFPGDLPNRPIPEFAKGFLDAVAPVAILGASLGAGLYWSAQRRRAVAEAKDAAEHVEEQS